ncbi:hypothetical protein DOY81_002776, partial [Sarcophaga bullata]
QDKYSNSNSNSNNNGNSNSNSNNYKSRKTEIRPAAIFKATANTINNRQQHAKSQKEVYPTCDLSSIQCDDTILFIGGFRAPMDANNFNNAVRLEALTTSSLKHYNDRTLSTILIEKFFCGIRGDPKLNRDRQQHEVYLRSYSKH